MSSRTKRILGEITNTTQFNNTPRTSEEPPNKKTRVDYEAEDEAQRTREAFELRQFFAEATRAEKKGSLKLKKCCKHFPGFKFSRKDEKEYGQSGVKYATQAVYSSDNRKDVFVTFEGWAADTGRIYDRKVMKESAPSFAKDCETRDAIVAAIAKNMKVKDPKSMFYDGFDMRDDPKSMFWCFEDLAYFISEINKRVNQVKVFFFVSKEFTEKELEARFPDDLYVTVVEFGWGFRPSDERFVFYFLFVSKSYMTEEARKKVEKNRNTLEDLLEDLPKTNTFEHEEVCPSNQCRCAGVRYARYSSDPDSDGTIQQVEHTKEGLLTNMETARSLVVIECSDTCGCTINSCPTRQLQRGSNVPLAVVLRKEMGYEVRAGRRIKKGEFIIEYIGLMTCNSENEATYLLTVHTIMRGVTIDATDYGNVSRYINHSCDPNTQFLEVHTRQKYSDLLVPRIGVFATRDIEIGEPLTVFYFQMKNDKLKYKGKTINCLCKSKNCIKKIPDMSA